MFVLYGILVGLIFGIIDVVLYLKNKRPQTVIHILVAYAVLPSIFALAMMKYVLGVINIFVAKLHGPIYILKFVALVFIIALAMLVVRGFLSKHLHYEYDPAKHKAWAWVLRIFETITFVLGAAALTGTMWARDSWGDLSPDQMVINLNSPTTGTSTEVILTVIEGPILAVAALTAIFCVFAYASRKVVLSVKGNDITVFSSFARRIAALVISVAMLAGGLAYGIEKMHIKELYNMYMDSTTYIEDRFVDPNKTELKFPEKKRNLIHIYLESVENTYFSQDLGGYGFNGDNLMPDLAELTKEGYNFSHLGKGEGIGGHHMSMGATWSVASMVNMNTGLPMKVPVGHNSYGQKNNFLPGATTLGDILKEQGYNQTLMFGADAAFGGLNFFYESHGDFRILDYPGVIKEGWLEPDYKVWWGFEDDKLYEYAKRELTRLAAEGKPFNFTMETADTHFPDGYLSKNCKETPYKSQYANVIKYSQAETVKFVRWIQEQDFYENTTIVIIGDHLSMDKNYFKDYVDPKYDRTCYSVILNPAEAVRDVPESALYNRQWAAFDMFPTILSSLGVEIPGNRLGIGTDLFSGEKTLFEKEGIEEVNKGLESRSNFYNTHILFDAKQLVGAKDK